MPFSIGTLYKHDECRRNGGLTTYYNVLHPYTESEDFSLSTESITFPPGRSTTPSENVCVNVTATDDDILEGDEDFVIAITGTDLPEVTLGNPNSATVLINDNDGIFVLKLV